MARKKPKPTREQQFTINPQRLVPTVERRESFWLTASRERFTAQCAQQAFRYTPGPLLKSWTDEG